MAGLIGSSKVYLSLNFVIGSIVFIFFLIAESSLLTFMRLAGFFNGSK
jgi:hypothetical protein